MKILICPDSFKGTLTAKQAAAAMAEGFSSAGYGDILRCPLADGGEGSAEILAGVLGGKMIKARAHSPLGEMITAEYALCGDTAVIESAAASGLTLIPKSRRRAMEASSRGTGELMLEALEAGALKLIVTLGGSAMTDGGTGALSALGVRFCGADGALLPDGGGSLSAIESIDVSGLDKRLKNARIHLLSDVRSPLCGQHGSAYVFARQKGASDEEIRILDRGLAHFAGKVYYITGKDCSGLPGAGAAGGLGFGLCSFCGAEILPGFAGIADAVRLEELIGQSDLVVTGEGKTDATSAQGKLVGGVAAMAEKYSVPCVVISGAVENGLRLSDIPGAAAIYAATPADATAADIAANASTYLRKRAAAVAALTGDFRKI